MRQEFRGESMILSEQVVRLKINGKDFEERVVTDERLIDFLRRLGFKGVKEGCGSGECGACTIIMDNKAVCSCILYALQADGSTITTIEGLEGSDGKLHPIQEAFIKEGAVQCGFCTPGMILSAKALLDKNSNPTEEEIREAISGNFCRCTGYAKIVSAIKRAASVLRTKKRRRE